MVTNKPVEERWKYLRWIPSKFISEGKDEVSPIIIMRRSVFTNLDSHAKSDLSKEVAGFLLGHSYKKAGERTQIVIEHSVPAKHVNTTLTSVQFTPETWSAIEQEQDKYPGEVRLGWYHSHPGHGVFLSPDDLIVQSFFNLPHQVALVIDPRRNEGAFFKNEGKTVNPSIQYGFYEVMNPGEKSLVIWKNLTNTETGDMDLLKKPDTQIIDPPITDDPIIEKELSILRRAKKFVSNSSSRILILSASLLIVAIVSAWILRFNSNRTQVLLAQEVIRQVIASDNFESNSFSGGQGWIPGSAWFQQPNSLISDISPQSGPYHLRLIISPTINGTSVFRVTNLKGYSDVYAIFYAKKSNLSRNDSAYFFVWNGTYDPNKQKRLQIPLNLSDKYQPFIISIPSKYLSEDTKISFFSNIQSRIGSVDIDTVSITSIRP